MSSFARRDVVGFDGAADSAFHSCPDGGGSAGGIGRGLLTDDERDLLFAIPADQEALIQHYTLTLEELELALGKRGARNRLGLAVQLCLLRDPGFGLSAYEAVPEELLRYLGVQLGIPSDVYRDYSRRSQTRTDHAQELAILLGLRSPGRGDVPLMIEMAAATAWATDRGVPIVAELMAGLRSRKFILPTPDTLERTATRGRARARRLVADALLAPFSRTNSRSSMPSSSMMPSWVERGCHGSVVFPNHPVPVISSASSIGSSTSEVSRSTRRCATPFMKTASTSAPEREPWRRHFC
jgi:hypothetical protein